MVPSTPPKRGDAGGGAHSIIDDGIRV